MRATHCLRIGLSAVAALAVACGKADAPADPQHEAVRHDHAGHAHEGHADGPGTHHEHGHPREALDVSSNPYVYEPRDAAAEPAVVPVGEPAGD
ncbi:MAG TPA: hypothetical protein PK095_24070, partial [Myxococcota bacterium]|nr:hypothetical protein [Myxococcota bacterium]